MLSVFVLRDWWDHSFLQHSKPRRLCDIPQPQRTVAKQEWGSPMSGMHASCFIWCMVSPTLLLSVALCKERCCHLSATVNYSSLEGNPSSLKSKIIWKLDSERCYFPTSEPEILHNSTSSAQLPAQKYASEQFRVSSQATLMMQVRKMTASGYVLKSLA